MPDATTSPMVLPKGTPWYQRGWFWLWLALIGLVLDQVTKVWAVSALSDGTVIAVMPSFNFRLAYNFGAAFSFLAGEGGWQRWFFTVIAVAISIGILVWMYKLPKKERLTNVALALVLSGALGNLYDRLAYGYVVDFIDWYYQDYHWPTFNLADAFISIGAALLIIDSFRQPQGPSKPSENE